MQSLAGHRFQTRPKDALDDMSRRLQQCPELLQYIGLRTLLLLIVFANLFKDDILLAQSCKQSLDQPPAHLPPSISIFLATATETPVQLIPECWRIFRDLVWDDDYVASLRFDALTVCGTSGIQRGLTAHVLYPPVRCCTMLSCAGRPPMKKATQSAGVVYTQQDGAVPLYAVALICTACETQYHHNYLVHKEWRTYYEGIPDFIAVAGAQYVERRLANMWTCSMQTTWSSASGLAQVYNDAIGNHHIPPGWSVQGLLRDEHVMDAFTVLALLKDSVRQNSRLQVPHDGEQADRFLPAMQARNLRIERDGYPHKLHYCDVCTRFYDRRAEGGTIDKVSCVVMDGITIGHPCCASPHCKIPLSNQKHRYCPAHWELHEKCVVEGCARRARRGKYCCSTAEHCALEDERESGSAISYLAHLLQARERKAHPTSTRFESLEALREAASEATQVFDIGPGGKQKVVLPVVAQDPKPGHRRIRAQFARRRTHNEQTIQCACGVFVGRRTCYHSESDTDANETVKCTFNGRYRPEHLIYDRGCIFARYLHNRNDTFYDNIGITVDVFHWKCKHKKTDAYCREHCNPYAYPELRTSDGKGWYFNSAIAEQNNVWLGGFNSILREMVVERYNFFLDEMIMLYNDKKVATLQKQGKNPGNWNLDHLM